MTSYTDEFGKSIAKFGETLLQAPFSVYDAARYVLDSKIRTLGGEGLEELTEEDLEERERIKSSATRSVIGALGFDPEKGGAVFTEEGKVREAETIPGAVGQVAGEIGAYVLPYTAVSKAAGVMGLGAKYAAPTAGVVVSEQLLTDPKSNLFNFVEETFPEASKNTFVEYMSADPDDEEVTNRMRMVAQDAILIPMIERGISFAATLKKMGQSKSYDKMSEEEQTEVVMSYLENARKEAKRANIEALKEDRVGIEREDLPTAKEVVEETTEGVEQIKSQASPLKRFYRRFMTSEGYFTPQAYNAFKDTQYSQRQTIKAAENISNRLNLALKKITDETLSKEMSDRVQQALQVDASFIYEMPQQERVEFFRTQYRLSEEVASEVLNARELMDNLSRKIVGSKGFSADVKQSISANVGNYMRRSYRMFEDPSFKPSSEVRENAVQFLADDLLEATPDMDIDDALAKAESQVEKILSKGEDSEVVDYLAQVRRVSKFKQKKDIPEPIRALLGEITSPSESIVLSVAKASRIYEVNNFYRQFNELGKSGGYITSKESGRNTAKITGTNSILDGKYTTPEMLQALERKEEIFSSVMEGTNPLAVLLQNFSTAKGFSQQMKTVLNHVTHIRNFLGGAQFGIANGLNPFSNKGLESVRTLSNSILQGGDKALDAAYEKYLRLGLINTNVKVNEFRALLETGMEREPSFILKKLESLKYAEEIPGVRQVDAGTRAFLRGAENIYMATDDFYKINAFGNELATLKKAFPDIAEDVLEIKAAQIVQDTIPNYDKVPKGIKALRDMPIGNFVSFPAEIARTSYKIVKQASEEINSGNSVLRNRGLKRLAGFSTAAIGFNEASRISMDLLGWTEEEKRAHTDLAEGAFNKDSNKIWRMDEDGQIYFVDTRFLDSYEFVKRPIMIAMDRINQGALRGDALNEVLFEAAQDTAASLLEPFASQEMITEAMLKSGIKYKNGYIDEAEFLGDVLQTFVPGSVTSIQKYVEALNQEPNRYTGESRNAQNELLTNMTGVRFTKYDPELNLSFAIGDYKRIEDANRSKKFLYDTDPELYIQEYREQQGNLYDAQQELFKLVNAYTTLYGYQESMSVLKDNGISESRAASLVKGQFTATRPRGDVLTVEMYNSLKKINPQTARQKVLEYRDSLSNVRSELNGSSLYTPEYTFDLNTDTYREGKAKGGEVFDVPNAPKEPDERIDKMTGVPYDQQAGTAFVDEEDPLRRLGLVDGGPVDPLARLGFGAGSLVSLVGKTIKQYAPKHIKDTDIEEAVDELELQRGLPADDTEVAARIQANIEGRAFTDPEEMDYDIEEVLEGIGAKQSSKDAFIETVAQQRSAGVKDADVPGPITPSDEDFEFYDDAEKAFYIQQIQEDVPSRAMDFKQALETLEQDNSKEAKESIKMLNKLLLKMPRTLDPVLQDDVSPNLPERLQEFIKDSEVKEPVYRATGHGISTDFEVNFALPSEIGPHFGTKSQADFLSLREYSDYGMDLERNIDTYGRTTDDLFETGVVVPGKVPAMTKGYLNIKNPLVIDDDFGDWSAVDILTSENFNEEFLNPVIKQSSKSKTQVIQAYEDILKPALAKYKEFIDTPDSDQALYRLQDQIRIYDLNIKLREFLKLQDFDGIKYLNTVEGSLEERMSGAYSYIAFDPRQYKIVTASQFDPTDPRVFRAGGGKVLKSLARRGYAEGSAVRDDMRRADGSIKSARGFLGPVKSVEGKTMTEFSTDMVHEGKKILIPTLVPTQTKEAIEYMKTMREGQGWNIKTNPMDKQIIDTARSHARMRLKEGKSPFYQDGE